MTRNPQRATRNGFSFSSTRNPQLATIFFIFFLSSPAFAQEFTAQTLGDFGNVTVMEVAGNYDAKTPDGALNREPREIIAKEFFRTHKDEYDFLVFFSNFDYAMLEPNVNAFYIEVKNDVQGIGRELFDNSDLFGSAGKLQGTIDMGNIANLATDPLDPGFEQTLSTLSHEMLHRWGVYVKFKEANGQISEALLGEDKAHWSFLLDSGGSVLYGNRWRDNGDGTFTSIGIRKYWSPLDLYLMGMIDKTQVPPMLLIENPNIDPARLPEEGATISGTARTVTIDQIIAAEGERIPGPAASQKRFKSAFILLTSPGSFTGAELPGIESIRNGWITRVSILNDGKGIMQVAATPKEDLPRNPGIPLPPVTPRTLPPNIDEGVSWLMANQREDGSWRDLLQTMERDTSESVLTLQNFSVAQANYAKGLLWLKGTLSANLDYLARKTEALTQSGENVAALIAELLARQNPDGGWGSNRNYLSNPTDTALALKTLAAAGYSDQTVLSKAIDDLKARQNADGGWGSGDGSTIQSTVHVLSVFHLYRGSYPLEEKIAGGITFLLQKQNVDGGFGNSPSTVYDTALAVLALRELDVPTDVTNRAINYLLPLQSNDGSWYGSAYQTAVAVQAVLKGTIDPDLSVKAADIQLIPATVTSLPTDVVIRADLWNLGRTAVSQAKVVLYDGAITDQNKIGEQIVAFPGQSSVTVTFSATIRDGNPHRYSLLVDPDGQVKESNESNNTALKVLSSQTTYDFQILSGDFSASATAVDFFQNVTLFSKVSNRGTTDAFNVPLRYYINDPEGVVEIATVTVDLPAGGTIDHQVVWKANKAGTNLPMTVAVDPTALFTEISETNNQASISLTVNPLTQPNLTISHQEIVITPSPADEGESAQISALIRNEGFSAASDFNVQIYRGVPGAGGVLLGAETIALLQAGESTTTPIEWPNIAEAGERIIYVQVDPENRVTEISEEDNETFTTLRILSLPDLTLSTNSIRFTPAAPKEGERVSIQVTVQNQGEQPASNLLVRAYEGESVLGSQTISAIPGNGQGEAAFSYDTIGKVGPHEIRIVVDPDQGVRERNEGNNQSARSFGVQDANLWLTEPYISPNGDGVKESTQFFFRLAAPQTVKVEVVNKKGETVRNFSDAAFENTTGGNVTWDGRNDKGAVVDDGIYQMEVRGGEGSLLALLSVIVDTNRSSLIEAIGTKYLHETNLTCLLPYLDTLFWDWLPNESGIVFSLGRTDQRFPDYKAGVYVMELDGEGITRIIPIAMTEDHPEISYSYFRHALSPDGEQVAFVADKFDKRTRTGTQEIWWVGVDGQNLTLLTEAFLYEFGIEWSPDSKKIMYVSERDRYTNYDLWVLDVETREKMNIDTTNFFSGRWYDPERGYRWSPDGTKIAYVAFFTCFNLGRPDCNHVEELRVWDLQGNKRTVFSATADSINEEIYDFRWVDNERVIYLESDFSLGGKLWLVDTDVENQSGKILSDLFDFDDDTVLVSADRKSVFFTSANYLFGDGDAVYVKRADLEGNVENIYEHLSENESLILSMGRLIQSPDSSKLAFFEQEGRFNNCGCEVPYDFSRKLIVLDSKTGQKTSLDLGLEGEVELIGWMSDGVSVIASLFDPYPEIGLYAIHSGTGESKKILSDVILPFPASEFLSPLGQHFAYYKYENVSSACSPGSRNLWNMRSLLNLATSLRASKADSDVLLRGIATDLHFEEYQLEYADTKQPDLWNPIRPPSDIPVVNGILASWIPPYEGTFSVRLTVRDKAGNIATARKRVSWGRFSSITNLYKTLDLISPNGDGIKDTVELHYRVIAPVHLSFDVYDAEDRLIRTFSKNHTAPTEDFITWDGRDSAGNIVPDGVYNIKVFDSTFFVEVDTTAPDTDLQFSRGTLPGVLEGNLNQYKDIAELYVLMAGHVLDKNLKDWVVEYGEGLNPSEWKEFKRDTQEIKKALNDFGVLVDPKITEFDSFNKSYSNSDDMEWLVGKKFKVTAEDLGGNRQTRTTDLIAQQVIFYKWDGLAVKVGASLPGKAGGLHSLGLRETVRESVAGMTVQYYKAQEGSQIIWQDGATIVPSSSGGVEIPWDSSHLDPNSSYMIRVKVVDILGNAYYSNEAFLPGPRFGISIDCSDKQKATATNLLVGALRLLKFQYKPGFGPEGDWIDFKIYDASKGGIIPSGVFDVPLPSLGEGQHTIRMLAAGVNGESYSVDAKHPPECGKEIELGLEVEYLKAPNCDLVSGKASLFAKLAGIPDKLLSLIYSIQKPEGIQVLHQIDLSKERLEAVTVDTSALPEGSYPVRAELIYVDLGVERRVSAENTLLVDRVLPAAQITDPGSSQRLCPQKFSDQGQTWNGIPVEGAATDDKEVKRYTLFYGSGENPQTWSVATTRKNGEKIPITGSAIQGRLGIWDITDLNGETFTLKLEVVDVAGNVKCYTVVVHIDASVEVNHLASDRRLFSPNGDGVRDDVTITYEIDEVASVDVRVFKLITDASGKAVLDATPIRTITSGAPHSGGNGTAFWDGKGDSGASVPDGKYAIAVSATDLCGNTKLKWIDVEVDKTMPTANIVYPTPVDPLGNIVEVKGTGEDLHFQNYILEAGEGRFPDQWILISSDVKPTVGGLLGKWNTFGINGQWTLRLTAADQAGNSNIAVVTIDLGARKDLIKDLSMVPNLFSPNGDGRRDTAAIHYELTDAASVTIEMIDANGSVKRHLSLNVPGAGTDNVVWDGKEDAGVVLPDGAYAVRMTAVLSSNASVTQTETVTVSVDTGAPLVNLQQPLDQSFFRTDFSVNGTISDPNLLEYTLTYTGETGGAQILERANQNRENYIFGLLQELPEENYTLHVLAKDGAENITEKNIPFTVDHTPPKATLDTPKEGDDYGFDRNIINVTGAIVERNLESYRLRYGLGENPTQWTDLATGAALPTQPQLFAWNIGGDQGIPDGLYTLSLYIKDKAGFEAETKVKVTLDNTPPQAAITLPQEGGYIKQTAEIQGSAFDQNLDTYAVEFSEGACSAAFKWAPIKTAKSSVNDGLLASWSALPLDGEHCLRLTVADKVGQKSETKVQVNVDTNPPAAPLLSGQAEDKTNVNLTWSANSEPDLAGYHLYRGIQKVNAALLTGRTHLDLNLAEGEHAYTVKAVDLAGWESTPSNEIKIKIDLTGPTVKIRSPQEGAKISGQVDIKGSAYSQDDFKEYRIFVGQGAAPSTWTLIRTAPLPIPFGSLAAWETSALTEGVYSIKLEGEDLIGNISIHQITVTVDNTPPNAPLLLSATPNGADVNLAWQANTEADLAGYLLYRNDQLANVTGIAVGDLKPYLISGTTYLDKTLPDGTFEYHLVAIDQAGNESDSSNALAVNLDTHPPHLTLTVPLNQSKFQETTLVKGETADLDVASVQFQYKREQETTWINLGAPVSQAPYGTYLDPAALALSYGDYHLRGIATDQSGKIDPSPTSVTVTYTDLTPPQAPSSLSAQTNGADIALAWSANTEGDLAGYNVYRIVNEIKTKINASLVQAPTYTDSRFFDGEYSYQVTAVDTFGNESKPSNVAAAKIYAPVLDQPYTPTGEAHLQISGTGAAAHSAVEIFQETLSGLSSVGSAQADAEGRFSLANITLILGENRLTARAADGAGNISRRSDAVLVVYNEPPATPTGLAASVLGYDVSLTWNPNSEPDILGYYLYRNGAKVNGPVAVTEGNANASFSYYFAYPWQAFDGDPATYWMSFYYNDFTPFEPVFWEIDLPSPELISRFEIEWGTETDSEGKEILYGGKEFEVQLWNGLVWVTQEKVTGNSSKKNTFEFNPAYRTDRIRIYITDLAAPEGSKQVRINEVGVWKERPITSASYDDLQRPDGAYTYTLRAVDQYGFESAPTASVSVIVGDIVPPAAPSGLTAAASASNSFLNWSANTESDLSGYNVYRFVSHGWIKINPTVVTATAYPDAGLPNGVYTYRVTAVDAAGNESAPSNEASATISIPLPPAPPRLAVSSPPEGRMLTATWDPATGVVSGYRLYRGSLSGSPYTRVNEALLTGLSYTDSGLTDGVTYYYVVVAVDAVGNESLFSNEAAGVPTDTVAPESPILFFPTLSGAPVIVYNGATDVAGFGGPDATVVLLQDGLSVAETTARGSDLQEKFVFDYDGNGTSLSVDGKQFAYTSNGGIWLKVLETGEMDQIIQEGSSPVLSPDGSRLAYQFLDENFNSRIGLYDVKSGTTLPLTDDEFVYEYGTDWSADGGKIAFFSDRSGALEIWIKELATGSLTQSPGGRDATRFKLSPDGRKLAYFKYSALYVTDLFSGVTVQIDARADGYSLAWSPDSREIAFISFRNGPADIFRWNMESQAQIQVTDSPQDEYDLVWSPEGRELFHAGWEGNGYAVRLLSLSVQGEGRVLQQGLHALGTLFWARSGEMAFVNDGALTRISPAGHFRFADVPLDIGENLFSAAARDAAGNTPPSSPEIAVVFDPGRLPDLDLSEEDLFIYPLTPVAGEKVSVGATVRNKGAAEASHLKVDLYLWDATGSLELLKSETIGSLLPGAETMITALWDSGGKVGTNTVMVLVDPDEEVDEIFEENNFATRDFIVTAAEGISMTTTLDADRYSSSQDVHISVQLSNSGPAREVVGEVRVEDINGELVTLLPSFQTALAYAASRKYDFVWNTGSTYAGPYTVHTILRNPPEVIAENRIALEILPDLNLESTVTTDKGAYQAEEEVGLRINVKNRGRNFTLSQLTVQVKITDPAGNLRWSSDQTISSLLPGASSTLHATWNTGLTAPGDYRAVADVYLGDQLLQNRSALFKVNPSLAVTGTVAATPPVVFFDQNVTADYTVQNKGNIDANSLIVRLRVIDPETETIVQTTDETIDLAMGATRSGRFTIQTGSLSLKSYLISLQYLRQGTPTNLGQTSFAVKDGTAPVISIRSPLADQLITSTVRIEAIVTDSLSGVDRVEVEIAGASWKPVPIADLSRGRYVIAWTPVLADAGIRTIRIRATDRAGNQSLSSVSVKVAFPPVSDAGPDQTVNEGVLVMLDGSGSRALGGNPLTYRWEQIAGPAVSLNLGDPVHPTFTSPDVPLGGATLTFGLIVEEDGLAGIQDVVNVTVKNVNHPPVAEAGEDQAVTEGAEVFLDGAASYDPDGEGISYHWIQTAGPIVTLSDATMARPSFMAPFVGSAAALLVFDLTVDDGVDQATDFVQVVVEAANHPPTANAGADQTKDEGALVSLDGSGSSDPDGDNLNYVWTQLAGPTVSLSNDRSPTPSFTSPTVEAGGATLLFQLVVNDGLADSAPDQMAVTVLNRNDPPVCGQAKPSAALLWPPNHKLVEIAISGVTDPENDPVSLTITGVTQDEPVNGTGDGDTAPDAVIQGGKVLLRAERSGAGNGRVYRISFTARDSDGGACTGSVAVGVPNHVNGTMIDDGQLYDSTGP